MKTKEIIDDDGIIYEEVSYGEYLKASNKHRIIKNLEAQYFVEEGMPDDEVGK